MNRIFLLLLLCVGSFSLMAQEPSGDTVSGVARVVDGDTLVIQGQRIRFFGVDAPESSQSCGSESARWACGQEAGAQLREKIAGAPVVCEGQSRDPYGRLLATCYTADGEDLNGWMVSQGLAIAYTRYSSRYAAVQNEARARGVGVWSGEFENPETYRHGASPEPASRRVASYARSAMEDTGDAQEPSQSLLERVVRSRFMSAPVGRGMFAGAVGGTVGAWERQREATTEPLDNQARSAMRQRSSGALALPEDDYREQGRRVAPSGRLSGAQVCALAAQAGLRCVP